MLKRKNKEDKEKKQSKKDKNEKKQAKKVVVNKSCREIIPIIGYDNNLACFKKKDKKYMDILKIISKDMDNMSEDEVNMEIINFIKILKVIPMDIKLVSMNFPLNTQKQRNIFEMKREKIQDIVRNDWIDIQIDELYKIDANIQTREFYIFIFADNEKEFIKNKDNLIKYTQSGYLKFTEFIEKNEKINILKKLANMNSMFDIHDEYIEDIPKEKQTRKRYKKMSDKKEIEEFDENLFINIQPRGGISFANPSYIRCGDGYVRCLHVYELPAFIHKYWLSSLFNIHNCVCTIDISSKDINEVKKNINKSISEEQARQNTENKFTAVYESEKREAELKNLFDEISHFGEVLKLCDLKIFTFSRKLDELEELSDEIVTNLEADSYKVTTLLNEQKFEFMSLYEPYKYTHEKPFYIDGLHLTSEQIAMGFPFSFSQLIDDGGFLLGFSETGGAIVFNPFLKTKKRKYYNAIVSGNLGSGKSTHLKKIFKYMASIGGYLRVFDASGEFTNITNEFGGKIIKCNGKEGMLNPLEILKSGEDDSISYSNHITKIQSFFKCIMPSITDTLLSEVANELRALYEIYELTPRDDFNITGRSPSDYPILSEFKNFLIKRIDNIIKKDEVANTEVETSLNIVKAKNLQEILLAVENLVNNYGMLFDGHSSINDISKEKIVTFDISSIKDLGNVFTAQMQNMASLCWDNAVLNGQKMKDMWDKGEIEEHEEDGFLILIDESHRWINTNMPMILDNIIKYKREARKYFTGFILASQSIRDYMPEATQDNMEKIKMLFELSQYKFMFKQDSSVVEHIKKIFGNNMTDSQAEAIPILEEGEVVLSITGDRSIKFKEWLSEDYEKELFAGGK